MQLGGCSRERGTRSLGLTGLSHLWVSVIAIAPESAGVPMCKPACRVAELERLSVRLCLHSLQSLRKNEPAAAMLQVRQTRGFPPKRDRIPCLASRRARMRVQWSSGFDMCQVNPRCQRVGDEPTTEVSTGCFTRCWKFH